MSSYSGMQSRSNDASHDAQDEGNAVPILGQGSSRGQHAENVNVSHDLEPSMQKEENEQQEDDEFDDAFKNKMRTAANMLADLAKDPQFVKFLNTSSRDSKGKKRKSSPKISGQQGIPKEMPTPSREAPKKASEAQQLVRTGQGLQMQMQGQHGNDNPMGFGQLGMHSMMGQLAYFGGSTIFHAMVGQGQHTGMYGTNPYGLQQPMHGMQGPMYSGMAGNVQNPMYGSIGLILGAQNGMFGNASVPPNVYGAQGMSAGHANASLGLGHDVNTANAPFLQQLMYDNLTQRADLKIRLKRGLNSSKKLGKTQHNAGN